MEIKAPKTKAGKAAMRRVGAGPALVFGGRGPAGGAGDPQVAGTGKWSGLRMCVETGEPGAGGTREGGGHEVRPVRGCGPCE